MIFSISKNEKLAMWINIAAEMMPMISKIIKNNKFQKKIFLLMFYYNFIILFSRNWHIFVIYKTLNINCLKKSIIIQNIYIKILNP